MTLRLGVLSWHAVETRYNSVEIIQIGQAMLYNKGTNLAQHLAYDCNLNYRPVLNTGVITKLNQFSILVQ